MDIPVYQYDMLDSTNTQCRRLAAEGVMDAVVTADCQTAGRGRMGRSFQSPPGLGLYLSVLWRTGLRTDTLAGGSRFHYGLDIAAEEGAVVSSFADGVVTAVGESSELGRYVTVSHPNGYSTLYAHCTRITASSGQQVRPGDPIAEVGQTGNATGPHLHFELHKDGVYVNPIYYYAAP